MKTPQTILNFTQQNWMPAVRQLQRLQADLSATCLLLGIPEAAECEISLAPQNTLVIKTSAAMATRLRQIAPELKTMLNAKAWDLSGIELRVVRDASSLSKHLRPNFWLNPNEVRYGKRQAPTVAQRAIIVARLKPKLLSRSQTKPLLSLGP